MENADSAYSTAALGCCGYSQRLDNAPGKVKDPVCRMLVDPLTANNRSEYGGLPYFFCSAGCKTKFEGDPERYLNDRPASAALVPEGTIYTCPMHPEIRQVGLAHARSAAWHSNRCSSRPKQVPTMS